MTELDFDVHFGSAIDKKVNWREVLTDDELDDDNELENTPEDVIGMLGFDPREFNEEPVTKSLGLSTIIKIGTARSGNYGHSGRPGKVGGSGPGGGETSGLFGRSDQEINDIETGQITILEDVFQRQLDAKDFLKGGIYSDLDGIKYYFANMSDAEVEKAIDRENQFPGQGNFDLVARVNKFDSQNALYDKLKDNKDFNEKDDI